ncbi:biopolymer transporter ExbD [Fontimonas sp. SYSU GA230001]|uniref:biopolymer transporter ExbD n=1 Tax=Fontimonas sp. SYSU GA230001 TaxID=3142450 RepID=UPI0032B39D33
MRLRRTLRPRPVADMLPILNVVLLLLAFFLMLVRFAPAGVRGAELPRSAAGAPDRSGLPLLTLDADGRLAAGPDPLADAQLGEWLRRTQADGVRLQAHPSVSAVRTIAVIGILHAAGARRVLMLVTNAP